MNKPIYIFSQDHVYTIEVFNGRVCLESIGSSPLDDVMVLMSKVSDPEDFEIYFPAAVPQE